MLVSGDEITVIGEDEGTVRITGGRYRAHCVQVYTVRSAKIVRFEQVVDNGEVVEAFMPAEVGRG